VLKAVEHFMVKRTKAAIRRARPVLSAEAGETRVGNLSAMLEMMRPLQLPAVTTHEGSRRLLADLCRFVGASIGANDLPTKETPAQPAADLPPRLVETLALLLQGHSEKQVARALGLSVHTVHVYVKSLYRRYDVSSRAELLALHVR